MLKGRSKSKIISKVNPGRASLHLPAVLGTKIGSSHGRELFPKYLGFARRLWADALVTEGNTSVYVIVLALPVWLSVTNHISPGNKYGWVAGRNLGKVGSSR